MENWKKRVDNGVVFLIATEDRTMSIQQGRAVEQYLTASVAGQILDYIVTPNFRKGDWYAGINGGTSAIMEAVQGKFKPVATTAPSGNGSALKVLVIAFIIFIIIAILFGNRGGGRGGGNYDDDDDVIISRRGRRNYPGGFFPFPAVSEAVASVEEAPEVAEVSVASEAEVALAEAEHPVDGNL